MTSHRPIDLRTETSRRELTDDQLEQVSGGEKVAAPRDSVSGNATGRRAYKPVAWS
jgi:bacteriocin-like protein